MPLLRGLCSSDEYGFWNVSNDGVPTAVPPFALSFSTVAMEGHALAAGDEEGIVTILDTRQNLKNQMHEPRYPRFTAHDNAIFDIVWLQDDSTIATASGDATIRIFDVESSSRLALLRGHTGSAKCVRPCPSMPQVLLTAARDGDILGFDIRVPTVCDSFQERYHSPVLKISHPHMRNVRYSVSQFIGRKRRRVHAESPSTCRVGSVTSLAFSPMRHSQLYSSGASDGAVKLWDLRQLSRSVVKPTCTANTPVASVTPGSESRRDDSHRTGRPHGIANLDIDADGRHLLASSTDSSIYIYKASDIALGYDKILTGHTQTSFYIRARFSPDGQFVLSGSADAKAYIWDLKQRCRKDVLAPFLELAGHRGGEASAVDWCKSELYKVAICADDSTTRVWHLPAPAHCADESAEPMIRASVPTARCRRRKHRRPLHAKAVCLREQDIRCYFPAHGSRARQFTDMDDE